MRHRRRAALTLCKEFLHFKNLRALQVSELRGELLKRPCQNGQSGHHVGMPVSLQNLRADIRRLQSKPLADPDFNFRINICVRADSTGDLTVSDLFARLL